MHLQTSQLPWRTLAHAGVSLSDEFARLHREFEWDIAVHARLDAGIWCTEVSGPIHFPDDAHDTLFDVEDESFWFRHRNQVIEQSLRRIGMPTGLWEVGAGNGCVARHLQQQGLTVAVVEPMVAGTRNALRRGIESVVCGRFEDLSLPNDSLPAVGCFDVLEHLERPEELVREIHRTLKPGGTFVATVPALNWLWSDADVHSGHFRRYTRSTFRALVAPHGFEVAHVAYFMMTLVVPMFCLRTIPSLLCRRNGLKESLERQMEGTRSSGGWSPTESLLRCESTLAKFIPLPLGTSVIGTFRKTAC